MSQHPAQSDDGFGRAAWLGATGVAEAEIVRHEERLDEWYMHQESVSASLCISEEIEGQVWLLNPHVVGEDGEWEAWDFASWHPGEVRYRSFWDLMEYQFGRYLT
ncbi:hypothetical protein ETD86_47485 [Nonomuraea turkmeniaca]|uniref:SMI1/KNR4 family protein n=1 Tax=Nonomuraea turkmeniaca TaxID=103838 RepID=A0A5S4EYA8_9ACTN|nr:hypothetical protein [Nonomuraea turkmeniaca]TMR08511.1 hypothetical protein ETD86_47485 [Nonomuraea turkmeniaca]